PLSLLTSQMATICTRESPRKPRMSLSPWLPVPMKPRVIRLLAAGLSLSPRAPAGRISGTPRTAAWPRNCRRVDAQRSAMRGTPGCGARDEPRVGQQELAGDIIQTGSAHVLVELPSPGRKKAVATKSTKRHKKEE